MLIGQLLHLMTMLKQFRIHTQVVRSHFSASDLSDFQFDLNQSRKFELLELMKDRMFLFSLVSGNGVSVDNEFLSRFT